MSNPIVLSGLAEQINNIRSFFSEEQKKQQCGIIQRKIDYFCQLMEMHNFFVTELKLSAVDSKKNFKTTDVQVRRACMRRGLLAAKNLSTSNDASENFFAMNRHSIADEVFFNLYCKETKAIEHVLTEDAWDVGGAIDSGDSGSAVDAGDAGDDGDDGDAGDAGDAEDDGDAGDAGDAGATEEDKNRKEMELRLIRDKHRKEYFNYEEGMNKILELISIEQNKKIKYRNEFIDEERIPERESQKNKLKGAKSIPRRIPSESDKNKYDEAVKRYRDLVLQKDRMHTESIQNYQALLSSTSHLHDFNKRNNLKHDDSEYSRYNPVAFEKVYGLSEKGKEVRANDLFQFLPSKSVSSAPSGVSSPASSSGLDRSAPSAVSSPASSSGLDRSAPSGVSSPASSSGLDRSASGNNPHPNPSSGDLEPPRNPLSHQLEPPSPRQLEPGDSPTELDSPTTP
jgi:hypothetical protein